MNSENKITTTFDGSGEVLTEHQCGVESPAELTFKCVNDFVFSTSREYEDLQYLCLSLVAEIEKLRK